MTSPSDIPHEHRWVLSSISYVQPGVAVRSLPQQVTLRCTVCSMRYRVPYQGEPDQR